MNFLETCTLAVTVLSPVHVGCGEDYEPTNYVIDEQGLYTFDPVHLMQHLSLKDREEFARIVERSDAVSSIQRFFYRHKSVAVQNGRLSAGVVKPVREFYDSRIGQIAQREQGGKNVLNKLEIARSAFNPMSGQPILPGSSVKGAIRTALLESLRNNKGFRNAREMEKQILGGSFSTDPLRLLKISDGSFRQHFKFKGKDGVVHETIRRPNICFQVNRKKNPNKFDTRGNINTLLECIPANTPRAFFAKCTIEKKAGQGNELPRLQVDFPLIAQSCNRFYLERFREECDLLKKNNYASKWLGTIEKWLSPGGLFRKPMDEGLGFLLRIGRHSGAESVTIDAPRSIKIMKGQGKPAEYAQEATTLWLAAEEKEQRENMQPFGWIYVQKIV